MAEALNIQKQFDEENCFYDFLKRKAVSKLQYSLKLRLALVAVPIALFLFGMITVNAFSLAAYCLLLIYIFVTPFAAAFVDFIVLMPQLVKFSGFEDILATPISNESIIDGFLRVANEINRKNLQPLGYFLGCAMAIVVIISIKLTDVWGTHVLILISAIIVWLVIRKFILSIGFLIALSPSRSHSVEVICGTAGLIISLAFILPSALTFAFRGGGFRTMVWNYSDDLIMFWLGFFLLVMGLPTFLASHEVPLLMMRRRRGYFENRLFVENFFLPH